MVAVTPHLSQTRNGSGPVASESARYAAGPAPLSQARNGRGPVASESVTHRVWPRRFCAGHGSDAAPSLLCQSRNGRGPFASVLV